MNPVFPRVGYAILLTGIFLGLVAVAGAKAPPAVQVLDVGSFRLEIAPERNWESNVKPEQRYVVFHYLDKPAMSTRATLGLFRLVVPAEARAGDRAELAAVYATHDISGAQQMLFKSNARLVPLSKKTKTLNSGQLFSFAEPLDVLYARTSSTTFIRAWVFFPRNYLENGVLFLVLGKQESISPEVRPGKLERAEEILGGIRDHP
jgi:hypothetical protein